MWKAFATALSFLTLIPAPFHKPGIYTPTELARSFAFFPLVGLILGAACTTLAWLSTPALPPLLLAVTITAALATLTRGLHLDGLSDFIDGLGGGYTIQRRLEIMKDSRTGAFGALTLCLAVAFKVAALDALIRSSCWVPLLLSPVLSRYAMALAAYKSPYARPAGGLGKPFLEGMTIEHLAMATLLAAIFIIPAPMYAIVALPITLATVLLVRRLSIHCLGGITGDVLGAVNEIVEILLLAIAACTASR